MSIDHATVAHRLQRVDLLLWAAVERQRRRPAIHGKGSYWGQVITDEEVDELLRAHGALEGLPPDDRQLDELVAASVAFRDAPRPGCRLARLRATFDLDDLDADLLLLALAPEVAAGHGRLFAYLHDQLDRSLLSVDLAARLLAPARSGRMAVLQRLLPASHLRRHQLLRVEGDGPHATTTVRLGAGLLAWWLDGPAPKVASHGEAITLRTSGPMPPKGTAPWRAAVAAHGRPLRSLRADMEATAARDVRLDGVVPVIAADQVGAWSVLADLPWPIVVVGHGPCWPERPERHLPTASPTRLERQRAWADIGAPAQMADLLPRVSPDDVPTLRALASRPTEAALVAAHRAWLRPDFGLLAHPRPARITLDELVLPASVRARLDHLVRRHLRPDLAAGARLARPPTGTKLLLAGPPGTGKTAAAEALAHAMRLDLVHVDAASLVSRWVGETSKHLRQLFDAAEAGTTLLLFDEGDALFGARDGRGSHDRYADQEVGYLLQRLESFAGTAVVTTNHIDRIEPAFLRRFGDVLTLPLPDATLRAVLWQRALPQDCDPEVDTGLLADALPLAGGSIANIVVGALVDAGSHPLRMTHLAVAAARELDKRRDPTRRAALGALEVHLPPQPTPQPLTSPGTTAQAGVPPT